MITIPFAGKPRAKWQDTFYLRAYLFRHQRFELDFAHECNLNLLTPLAFEERRQRRENTDDCIIHAEPTTAQVAAIESTRIEREPLAVLANNLHAAVKLACQYVRQQTLGRRRREYIAMTPLMIYPTQHGCCQPFAFTTLIRSGTCTKARRLIRMGQRWEHGDVWYKQAWRTPNGIYESHTRGGSELVSGIPDRERLAPEPVIGG